MTEKTIIYQADKGWSLPSAVERISSEGGAYALLIRLARPFRHQIGALGEVRLPPGAYLYLGSAYGPGGLRARLRRHLRQEKMTHWHVDHLTKAGKVVHVLAVPGASECDMVQCVLGPSAVRVPVAGFGSSDCSRCPAHLLAIAPKADQVMEALARLA